MSLKAVYMPKGRAGEYGNYCLNIYDGCPNRCYYCYVPMMRHMMPEDFHSNVKLRKGIVERAKIDAASGELSGKMVHLCFSCDPYPAGCDTAPTREIIKVLKSGGAHIQILTKNGMAATRDFDLLDKDDRFGVTLTMFTQLASHQTEPHAERPTQRLNALVYARRVKIQTWVSFEPIVSEESTIHLLELVTTQKLADEVKIGKMNYFEPLKPIDWGAFGRKVEKICVDAGQKYYIKADLRAEMQKGGGPHAVR